jgi:uncharacterized membrane protein
MLVEAITILLVLLAAFGLFIRQKKYFYLQAFAPLGFMPVVNLLLHATLLHLVKNTADWNRSVWIIFGIALLLTIVWMISICTKLTKVRQRLVYLIVVGGFSIFLCWLFMNANLL